MVENDLPPIEKEYAYEVRVEKCRVALNEVMK